MKRFVAGVLMGFAASCAVAFASPYAKHDGTFWNKLSPAMKRGYLNGYTDAMQVCVSKLDVLMAAGDLFRWQGSGKIIGGVETQLTMWMSELAREEAVNHLDRLYKDPKFAELDLGGALQLIAVRPPDN